MRARSFTPYWDVLGVHSGSVSQGGVSYQSTLFIDRWKLLNLSPDGDYVTWDDQDPLGTDLRTQGPIGVLGLYGEVGEYVQAGGDLELRVVDTLDRAEIPTSYTGLMIWDIEDWSPYWLRNRVGLTTDWGYVSPHLYPGVVETHWRAYVRAHHASLSSMFPELSGFGSMTPAEQELAFEETYIKIARPIHDKMLQTLRSYCPGAKIVEYGFPPRSYYQFADGEITHIRFANTKFIPGMARNWDYLGPWLYPVSRAVADSQTLAGSHEEHVSDWLAGHRLVCAEYTRVQALCEGKPILCFVGPFYEVGASSPLYGVSLNEMTARLQVQLCREHGFDGVIVWGNAPTSGDAAMLNASLAFMNPWIGHASQTTQQARVDVNSPLAIGAV